LGMATLVVPLTLILWQYASAVGVLIGLALGVALVFALRGPQVRNWFSQP